MSSKRMVLLRRSSPMICLSVHRVPSFPGLSRYDPIAISGYTLYRDGVLLATVTSTNYLDARLAPGLHGYNVAATDMSGAIVDVRDIDDHRSLSGSDRGGDAIYGNGDTSCGFIRHRRVSRAHGKYVHSIAVLWTSYRAGDHAPGIPCGERLYVIYIRHGIFRKHYPESIGNIPVR